MKRRWREAEKDDEVKDLKTINISVINKRVFLLSSGDLLPNIKI